VKATETILRQIELQAGDQLAIVTDTASDVGAATELFEAARALGAETVSCHMIARATHGEELPRQVAGAIASCDVAILLTSVSASYAPSVSAAIQAGVRILSMPGVRGDLFEQGAMTADYQAVWELTKRWGEYFANGKRVRLSTAAGTELTAYIDGRLPLLDTGRLPRGAGALTNMPAGEVAISPIEGTAEGRVIVDMTMSTGSRPLTTPIEITVERGRVARVRGADEADELLRCLERHGESARCVAEIALGTNPCSRHVGVVIEDEKRLGSAHMGLGHAVALGGKNTSTIHLDAIFGGVSAWVDGCQLLDNGRVLDESLRRQSVEDFPGRIRPFVMGDVPTVERDGAVYARWFDLLGGEHWAQIGDQSAAHAAADLLASNGWHSPQDRQTAQVCELLASYHVLVPTGA
jgi:leucyl aminopeptidase (aminopeptidase T)